MTPQDRSILSSYDFKRSAVRLGYSAMVIALIAVALSMLYPFGITVFSSLKSKQEIYVFPPTFWPRTFVWSNYKEGMQYIHLLRAFWNTALIFAGNAFFSLFVVGFASFGLSQLKVPFRRSVTFYFMSSLMIPSATYLIPNFLNLQSLGLLDSDWALWLPAGANAFYILLLRSFMDGINKELFAAARIDGASDLRCFFRIALPLSVPVLSTLLILSFSSTWNDWFWTSLVFATPNKYPIAALVYHNIIQSLNIPWNVKFSILTLVMIPPLVFFLVFQKNIVHGLNVSGVKG
ncbi:carbohydrate ABC transporter permease [Gorillibacterium massiliense]|uniref:carbohydrate ABC transporter permease n=1 Tax=Gorillibacterium massiliense TaxID=1280390 RepID=UPI0004BCAB1D|nr:carbohydrate ABC transporter permease [Gorillibacterium massiliense]